jgi:hypothetical protein
LHHKRLLKPVLKGKLKIKNDEQLSKFKHLNNLAAVVKKNSQIVTVLTSLLQNYESILGVNFNVDQATTIATYDQWKTDYQCIDFLLDTERLIGPDFVHAAGRG